MSSWLLWPTVVGMLVVALVAIVAYRTKRVMLVRVMLALLAAAIVPLIVGALAGEEDASIKKVVDYHRENIRGSLFTGFLTLGGFLLSLKTFIIVKMKEGLYDHDRYRDRVSAARRLHPSKSIQVFGELDRLRRLLFFSIVASITASVLQVTVGAIANLYSTAICFMAAAFVIAVLVQLLFLINANLRDWFALLEKDAAEKPESTEPTDPKTADAPAKAPA